MIRELGGSGRSKVGPFNIKVTISTKQFYKPLQGMVIVASLVVSRMGWMDSEDSQTLLVSLASSPGVSQPAGC